MLKNLRELIQQRRNRTDLYPTEAYWNFKAAKYEGTAASMWPNPHLNELYEHEQKVIVSRYLPDLRGLKLLDLGCGVGRFSRWFATQGARVTGSIFLQVLWRLLNASRRPAIQFTAKARFSRWMNPRHTISFRVGSAKPRLC